ncbi:G-type lectin S-receptor-like serine/threonine-protein kinase SD1-13 isoform X2 [Carya illinoinensis]|uniref:G-type lectin S-receptor-like serine/threonine-protein kinase SD1-13 isoform X2 n=1 Tax=Carya illinoinensis TaxID=32201 RepID=UPI001C727526|nr:G-type lectin S-receptor-like serine/threonine-protein kinase SD1-13 isoform X2 [Carya illinoinensis]
MRLVRSINLSCFLALLSSFCLEFSHATDTIAPPSFIKDSDQTIISNGGEFKLGFFSPANSTYRYVGIWYAKVSESPVSPVIWVANRDKPLKTPSGILTISEDGNLVVLDGEKTILWSSNVTSSVSNMSARLLDTGNLVLQENTTGLITWESFQHPSNSWLPEMKLSTNATTGKNVQLTSWKSSSDPAFGTFSAEGNLLETYSINGKDWVVSWSSLTSECDVYGKCGAFGNCNPKKKVICSCLEGFEPKNIEEWNRGDWTSGCVRRTPLQCLKVSTGGKEDKKDGFLKVTMMKTPSLANWSSVFEDECRYRCLEDCSCMAYAYESGIGCMSWTRDLIDSQKFSSGGVDLYVRVAYSELGHKNEQGKVIVIVTVVIGIVFMAMCTLFLCRWMAKRRGGTCLGFHSEENLLDSKNQDKLQELPIFSLEELTSATNNFHLSNKLGQGGFGPVYKGKLLDGQEIAVKRLARTSGQGLEEFMNEVIVISKLQHRNLVRLLGGCVEGEEKLLVYEYMPNKSLDACLFDSIKQELLDWKKRFNIIEGIGRGLLYLHRDSRLRIIHRDLKASNILLDEELNPKISDFGMARIFGGNEDQANTKRVVGTYGYMAPEYAMAGRFSEKSDVFSFGVLLLEIVSGRKISHFYHNEQAASLLGFAWEMWNMDNLSTLADPKISKSGFEKEIFRCIHVGLLCVQDFAKDRPTISIVISMLKSEIVDLPHPRQPAFTANQITSENEFSYPCSMNDVTETMVHGR